MRKPEASTSPDGISIVSSSESLEAGPGGFGRNRVQFRLRARSLRLRLLRRLNNLEGEQSDYEYHDNKDSLGSWLPRGIVIHETPNAQNRVSNVRNRDRRLVNPDNL